MKHRDNCYIVVRLLNSPEKDEYFYLVDSQVVGVYSTHERADEICAGYHQQVTDGLLPADFEFEVQIGTYYNE